jgi:hypothetical protein
MKMLSMQRPRPSIDTLTPASPARIDPDKVEKVKTIDYEPNTFVMRLNTPHSIHSVSPRGITDWPRRYVNFPSECYGSVPEGFFVTKQQRGLAPRQWFRATASA